MTPELLHRARIALGYSQQELAERLGVQKASVYRWEKGRMEIGNPERLRAEIRQLLEERAAEIAEVRAALALLDAA